MKKLKLVTDLEITNCIKLISYLKQVVCEDGYRIKRLITESKTNSHCVGNCYSTNILPKLPKRAERSIQKNTAYMPKKGEFYYMMTLTDSRNRGISLEKGAN